MDGNIVLMGTCWQETQAVPVKIIAKVFGNLTKLFQAVFVGEQKAKNGPQVLKKKIHPVRLSAND